MENFTILICTFVFLMLFIFACAFAYHKQSQDFLKKLADDDEPQSKTDIGKKVQGDGNVQPDSKLPHPHQKSPSSEVTLQSTTYPASNSDNLQCLSQPKGLVPYPVPYPVSNSDTNSRSNGSQPHQPPTYESIKENMV